MKAKLNTATARLAALALLITTLDSQLSNSFAQGTAFTYQGKLADGGTPANGFYDFQFRVFDTSPTNTGISLGTPNPNSTNAVPVSNGLFSVTLDFGKNPFATGASRWLEISVRTNGSGSFSTLDPRQELTPTPYAVYAGSVNAAGIAGPIADNQLSANIARLNGTNLVFTGAVQFNNTNSAFNGTFRGNGAGVTNVSLASLNTAGIITWPVDAFVPVDSPVVGNGPGCVIPLDGNGDGKPDLICANSGGNTLSILTNNGSGGFVLAASPTVGSGPACVIAADVNGDGKPDLICANSAGNTLSVLTNNGSGGFVLASSPVVGSGPVSVIAVDVNGDDKLDLVSANFNDGTLSVLVQQPGGGFSLISSPAVGGNPIGVVAIRDAFSNLDVVCANAANSTLKVFQSSGNGMFFLANIFNVGSVPSSITAADVNGDGVMEAITSSLDDNTLKTVRVDGFGISTLAVVGGGPVSITAADVNGDGKMDLITANQDNTLSVFINDGTGAFVLASSQIVGNQPLSAAAANVNGDGKTDLISANYGDNNLTVLLDAPTFSGAFVGNGSGLKGLSATSVTSGTLADARLSANVALLVANQSFTGQNNFTNAANSFSGNGTGLTGLSATNISGDRLADARLSPNVALRAGGNTFSGAQTFNGQIRLDSTDGFSQSAVGNFFIDAPFVIGGRLTALTNGSVGIGTNAPQQKLHVIGNILASGTITGSSDRNVKEHFTPVDPREVLDKVAVLPITRWNYRTEVDVAHVGPMAQDFYAAFNVGMDDKHISMVDADGVALAAIQGLNQKLEARSQELEVRSKKLQEENVELQRRLDALEIIVLRQESNLKGAKP